MAVSVDTVYQKVLTIANKEQRGYITPQEFNLLASKAQLEIFENYFHDIKMAERKPKNQNGYADEVEMVYEKLHPFMATSTSISAGPTYALPSNLYKIDTISYNGNEVVELSKKEILYTENNPLTKAATNRIVYVREPLSSFIRNIRLYPTPTLSDTYPQIAYWKIPIDPKWTFVVVSEKALYNASASDAQNFELDISEEENLVTRILRLVGVIIKQPDIQQAAMLDTQMADKEKNN